MSLLECVPNVSEGRDRAAIGRLAETIRTTPGVRLLDVHSDPSHHRSVFTMVGAGDALHRALLALGSAVVRTIDLRRHHGVHPRMGALDVVPFVPLAGASLRDAVEQARLTGRALAEALAVPVLFYEHAAAAPHRRPLEAVRRGGFAMLETRLRTADWGPDVGPPAPHSTAGAVAVGARPLLVAFNVQLDTQDVAIARAVATAVRARDGGRPGVKAMGVPLAARGLVQVSMNLTDLARTRPIDAFDAVQQAAAARGAAVVDSELVGLAPATAITPEEAQRMRVVDWHPGRTLEAHLASA